VTTQTQLSLSKMAFIKFSTQLCIVLASLCQLAVCQMGGVPDLTGLGAGQPGMDASSLMGQFNAQPAMPQPPAMPSAGGFDPTFGAGAPAGALNSPMPMDTLGGAGMGGLQQDPLAAAGLGAQTPALPAPQSFGGGMGADMGGMGGPLGGISMPSPIAPPQQSNPMSSLFPLMMMMGGDMKMRHLMMMNMMGGGGMMGGGMMSPFLMMNLMANM